MKMEDQQTTTKIVQIIPATGWQWVTEDGSTYALAAWGLTSGGEMTGLYADDLGVVEPVTDIPGFQGYRYNG